MKRLIINADDFGLTPGVNHAVIRAHRDGVLTSATLMAGGLAWQEAVELSKANPSLGVGVHLTLTALRPVLTPQRVPSLVDGNGKFRRQFWRAPLWRVAEVEMEWRAQIQRLVDAGLSPTHLDSHHHTHLWPGLTKVIARLAEEFGIPAARFISPESFRIMGVKGLERRIAIMSWRLAQGLDLAKPDTVVGIEVFPKDREGMALYLAMLGPGVHELFCHPGSANDVPLARISSLTEKRHAETELLTAPWLRDVLVDADINLVDYSYF